MEWKKQGLIFPVNGQKWWMQSHGTHPLSVLLDENTVRVFFSSRADRNISHIGYFDMHLDSFEIVNISEEPIISPGPIGHFDDYGTYTGSLVELDDNTLYMYYLGWNPGKEGAMFYSYIGLAISEDKGKTFKKYSNLPIVGRGEHDPAGVLIPFVLKDGQEWKMWYGSTTKWERTDDGLKSYYNIKYATSKDGIHWDRNGEVAVEMKPDESNVAHPYVLKENGLYYMWYSFVKSDSGQYQPGIAISEDGRTWKRMDDAIGLPLGPDNTEDMANSHINIFKAKNKYFMLYNGNRFGLHGVHMAMV